MTNIYTDSKGKTLTRKTAFIRSQELNANASGGIWTFEIDKSGNYYLWFQEAAKVGA